MPNSAINTGLVDYTLAVEQIPWQILNFLSDKIISKPEIKKKMNNGSFKWLPPIFDLLRTHVGLDFSLYKYNTVCRRIEHRMNACGIASIKEYVNYLRQNSSEIELLCKNLLITLTNFFRNLEAFEKIKQAFSQLLRSKPKGYCLGVWVPACSTGEEAYSLAILIQEYIQETKQDFKVQIFGTDVDEDAIEVARMGAYPLSISQDISAERLKHFFTREGAHYKISKAIRKMIIFAPQNLIKDPPFAKIDILSCRNFLIYITKELQKKLMLLFHYSLNPGGILFLGASENIGNFTDLFKTVHSKWKIFICQKTAGLVQTPVIFDNTNKLSMHNMAKGKKLGETEVKAHITKTQREQKIDETQASIPAESFETKDKCGSSI